MNPFDFRRKWTYKKKKPPTPPDLQDQTLTEKAKFENRLKEIEVESEKRIQAIQKQFDLLQQQVLSQTSKGKGRGKGASNSTRSSTRTICEGIQSVGVNDTSSISSFDILSNPGSSSFSEASTTARHAPNAEQNFGDDDFTTETVYIKKLELLLNG